MPDTFYQLDIWKDAYELTLKVYQFTSTFPVIEQYGLTNQLRRSASSITANIAESQGRYSYNDRIRVLYLARGEIFETRSHIKFAEGLEFIDSETAQKLDGRYEKLLKSLNAYIKHLADKRNSN